MATPNKIVLFDPNYLIDFKGNIKHIIGYGKYLYVFMVDGKIIKFDSNLKKIKQTTLPFADFFAPGICKGNIYTVTHNKYLVKITKDLNVTVYKGNDFDTSDPLRIKGCKIYNSDKVYFIE
jgi:glutamate synthase domain-containing protein 3